MCGRELSFRRGDIIFVQRQIDKNWYEGEHNAMIGLFPFNYVEVQTIFLVLERIGLNIRQCFFNYKQKYGDICKVIYNFSIHLLKCLFPCL